MPLIALMRDEFSVMKLKPGAAGRSKRGRETYEEVTDADGVPVRLRGRLETKARRAYVQGRIEKTADAQMVIEARDDNLPEPDQYVVLDDGRRFKIIEKEQDKMLGLSNSFVRLSLMETRTKVPATEKTGG
jgi:hypothetical protein